MTHIKKWLCVLLAPILFVSCNAVKITSKKQIKDKIRAFAFLEATSNVITPMGAISARFAASGACISAPSYSGRNILLTAGHFCERAQSMQSVDAMLLDPAFMNEQQAIQLGTSVIYDGITVYMHAGSVHKARIVKARDDDYLDACIIEIAGKCDDVLTIADEMPEQYDSVLAFSAPGSYHEINNTLVFSGMYNGIDPDVGMTFTIDSVAGSSGSPILNKHLEIVSMLTTMFVKMNNVSFGSELYKIRKFLELDD